MTVSFLAFASTIIFRLVHTQTCDKCDTMYLVHVTFRMILRFKTCVACIEIVLSLLL